MRNTWIVLLIVVFALSLGVAFAQDEDPLAGVDPTGVVIEYWHEWDNAQQTGIDAVITSFEESNPYGITVEQVQYGSTGPIREAVSTGIVSGELPNLAGAVFVDQGQAYLLDGILVPLDVYYNHPEYGFTEEEKADLRQDILDINRPQAEPFNGQLLAWPVGMSAAVLSVNIEMINRLNDDGAIDFRDRAPETLEEFRAVACAANELTTEDGSDVQGFPIRTSASDMYSFIVSQGGMIFDEEANAYNFTNEGAITTLQFFQDLFNDGCAYLPDGPFVNTADFAFGLNPMAVGSSVGVPFIQSDIEASGSGIENWINTTTPWSEGNRTLQPFLRGVGILQGTPEENLATWLFLKHWATTEPLVAWTENAQYQPISFSALDGLSEDFLAANPQFESVRAILTDPDINIWAPPAHLGSNEVGNVFSNMIVEILTGGRDVMEAAAEAEAEANEIYQESLEDM